MQPQDFVNGAPGSLRHLDQHDTYAFVPDMLPPKRIDLGDNGSLVEAAALLIGRLGNAGETMQNPYLLMRPLLHREARASSAIEGTFTTPQALLLFEAVGREDDNDLQLPDTRTSVREVLNYINAMQHMLRSLEDSPLTLKTFLEGHRVLMRGVRGKENRPGEFRRFEIFVGNRNEGIAKARYVPPPPGELGALLDNFEKAVHERPSEFPSLVWLAILHYQIEAIHPFGDGNGRMGRLLIPLLLCSWDVLPPTLPLLYVSPYFLKHRDLYNEKLLEVSTKGRWSEWVAFFLQAVTTEAASAWRRISSLRWLRNQYLSRFGASGSGKIPVTAIDLLFERPIVQVKDVAEAASVTPQTANSYVSRLVDEGVLRHMDENRKWGRTFVANEITNLLYGDDSEDDTQ